MQSFAAARSNWVLIVVAGVIASGLAVWYSAPKVSADTDVSATICVASSTVTITSPVSDSTVAEGSLRLEGTVSQANQVEVYIDDAFDSTIPLTIGQTQYSSVVQIPTGTHTLRVEAVDSCGSANGTATSVVTFTAPPSQPSVGSQTPTDVNAPSATSDQPQSADGRSTDVSPLSFLPLPQSVRTPIENGLFWLGIDLTRNESSAGRFTPTRAVIVMISMSVFALGFVPRIRHTIASSRLAERLMSERTLLDRKRGVTWLLIFGGGFVLCIALFW